MKVLHLLGAKEDNGGIVSVIRGIQSATVSQGVRHLVWTNTAFENLRQPPLELRKNRFILDESAHHGRLLLRAALATPALLRLLRTEAIDVIHAHTRGGFAVAMLLNRVFGMNLLFTNHAYANRREIYRKAVGWSGFNTVMLTPNMARHYGVDPTDPRISIISECGADRFWEAPLHACPTRDTLRLVGVGNLVRWKNWHLVLEALERLPEPLRSRLTFDLWGPTPKDQASQDYARELETRAKSVKLEGRVRLRGPTNDVSHALSGGDWFVLPSTNEPCSVALIEALALGMPAIVSQSGGNVDIVHAGKSGLLFSPDDAASLSDALTTALASLLAIDPPSSIRASVSHRSARLVGAEYLKKYQGVPCRKLHGHPL